MLTEGSLHLQLFLNGGISQLRPVPFHLCSSPEGALQPPWLVLDLLKLTLQSVKFRFPLHSSIISKDGIDGIDWATTVQVSTDTCDNTYTNMMR